MNLNEEYEKFINNFNRFISKDVYITNKMYTTYLNKYKYLTSNIHHNNKYYKTILRIIKYKNEIIKRHNLKYLNNKSKELENYFNNMFKNIDKNIKLDDNQKKAIITEDDNILLIAGAGSGKTTTMAAKVKYLVDIKNYKPEDIAVISFTNKACDEIKDIIYNKFNLNNVDVYTFHKLGLTILQKANKHKLDIIDDGLKYKIFINYIKTELFANTYNFDDFVLAFNDILKIDNNYKNFKNFKEYHDYMYKRKYLKDNKRLNDYLTSQINKRQSYYKTIKGEKVKSIAEVQVANYFYLNSIDYEYESSININRNKPYKPDFYIEENELCNYIEVIGLDKNNNNNSFTDKEKLAYINNLNLKREFHQNYKDLFIEINVDKDYKKMLKDLSIILKKKGYTFKRKTPNEIYEKLKNTSEDIYFIDFINKILIPFISYFKGSNYQKQDFLNLYKKCDSNKLKLQLKVVERFYDYYEKYLRENDLIDFDDMINLAYSKIDKVKENQLGVDYKYIIIDEYQDISMQKYNLTAKIANLFNAKIFAVGDDYQTIFSFSGARIDLLKNFKQYMKDASIIPIENTYRNSQELLDIAANFINKNKMQIEKKLKSIKHLDKPIEIYTYDNLKDKSKIISEIITKIYNNKSIDKTLLLMRYNKDINSLISSEYFTKKNKEKIICNNVPKADITYLTIHSSKGLGFDNCILINAIDDKFGFPSKIENMPLIKLIKPINNENILFPEERRLFYVALTRTKNKLYIVCPKKQVSSFVKEIAIDKNVLIHK